MDKNRSMPWNCKIMEQGYDVFWWQNFLEMKYEIEKLYVYRFKCISD